MLRTTSGVTVTLNGLEVTNGNSSSPVESGFGGGIRNDGGVFGLLYCMVSNNTAEYDTGGIYNKAGLLKIVHSTIAYNSALGHLFGGQSGYGGGILNPNGTVSVANSTISHNSAYKFGAAVCHFANTFTLITIRSTYSTIAGFWPIRPTACRPLIPPPTMPTISITRRR